MGLDRRRSPAPGPATGQPAIQVCVQQALPSPADELLKAVIAAVVGSLLGVGTFVAGQRAANTKDKREGEAAVSVVLKEMEANRGALNEAINPLPPGGTPPTPAAIDVSVFTELRVALANHIRYPELARTFGIYERYRELVGQDLRAVDKSKLETLRGNAEDVEKLLKPLSKEGK